MQGVTHAIGGAALASAVLLAMGPENTGPAGVLIGISAGALGGLIPDIDHPNSKISHKLKPVSAIVTALFSHRGLFHAPLFYAVLWLLWARFCPAGQYLILGHMLFVGIASHLLLDSLNPAGIPALLPFSSKKVHIANIRTGGAAEIVVRVVLIGALVLTASQQVPIA